MKRSLVSLSMITALWEKRRTDYLDNFVPFIATLANRKQIERIDITNVNSLCAQFEYEFGLKIPYHPMVAILNRCRRRGILKKAGVEFIFHRQRSAELDFSSEETKFIAKINIVVENLVSYATSRFKIDLDETLAEELILDLLMKSDMDILFACRETTSALPDLSLPKKHKRYHHILHRFVIYIHGFNPPLYRELADIAIGHVITNAILVYDHDWPGETVKNCSFYIDTPILFKLLGADGPEQQVVYSDLFFRLRKNGARFFVFDHSYVETNQILESSKIWVNNPGFDPVKASKAALFFRQAGYTDLDIEKFILRVDAVFSQFKIEKVSVPPFMELREHQIDEVALQKYLEQILKERDPLFDKELYADRTRRDIASISAIYRLRGENRPRFIHQAKYAFITNNIALILANKKYMFEIWHYEYELPACLTDVFVATVLWINSPPDASSDCRNRLLASCYAAVRPDPQLEDRLIVEARRMQTSHQISEDDFLLLSTSFVIRDLLADTTLNDRDAFTTKTIFEILEEIKARIRAEAVAPYIQNQKELELKQSKTLYERDRAIYSIEKIIDKKAKTRATFSNVIYGTILSIGVVVPLVLLYFVKKWYCLVVPAVFGLFGLYLGFVRGFTFRTNYIRTYQKYSNKFRKNLRPESIAGKER